MKYIGCVYETTNHITGKKYIGSLLYSRKNNWELYFGSNPQLKADIKEYGKAYFSKKIISEHINENELRKAEEQCIINKNAVESDNYYNTKYAAIGGDTFSTNPNKESIRKKHKENALGSNNHMYDKEKSETMINAVKSANSKRVFINGNIYKSVNEAYADLGDKLQCKISAIYHRIKSESYPNYYYVDDFGNKIVYKPNVNKKTNNKKQKVEVNGVKYESIAEAARQLNCSPTKIRGRLKFDSAYKLID